jgi:uncharacterized membrane protein YGL010W
VIFNSPAVRGPLEDSGLPPIHTEGKTMFFGKSWQEWIDRYEQSHQHPVNRICHTIGIPLIATSLPLFVLVIFVHSLWPLPAGMFLIGWTFQFVGHAVEGKPPEFFRDWRFLFVGLRWWAARVRGRV